ncbi:MAG: response regulator [Vicinamibacteria bacterium]
MPPTLLGVSVLLVEDNVDLRELLCIWLEIAGARVRQASDGHEALRAVRLAVPDVIICDLHMPGLDGCGFVDQMRRELKLDIPVIALTGSESERAVIRTLEAGFQGHLLKPVTREALVSQIGRALRH